MMRGTFLILTFLLMLSSCLSFQLSRLSKRVEFVGDKINVKEVDGGPLETAGTAELFEVMNW